MSVFRIPELSTLICQFSGSDCFRLLYVCRSTFHTAVPFIWHTVDGADKLLALLPGAECKYRRDKTVLSIELRMSGVINLGRYRFYAPHIKCLDVYGSNRRYFYVEGWDFIAATYAFHLQLPNLQSLKLQNSTNTGAKDQLFWISAFANHSTVDILVRPSNVNAGTLPWISTKTASVITQAILDRAPHVQKLSLYPRVTAPTDQPTDREAFLLSSLCRWSYIDILGAFKQLYKLTISDHIFCEPGLVILGGLPNLLALSLYNSGEPYQQFNHNPGSSEAFFPVLQKPSLRLTDLTCIEDILNTKSLIRRLTELAIRFCSDVIVLDEEEDEDEGSWVATRFFPPLKQAVRLQHLTIDFDMLKKREAVLEIWDFEFFAQRLVALPIQKLTLQSVSFALENFTQAGFDASLWPRLTHLHIPDQDATNEVLLPLSHLPILEHLHVTLHLGGIGHQTASDGASNYFLQTIEASQGSTIEADSDNLDTHVGFLLTLWPNLRYIVWPKDLTALEQMYVGCLNKHLTIARQIRVIADFDP